MNSIISNRQYLKETILLQQKISQAFLDLGERLKHIRDNRMYEGDYDTFSEFLMEIQISEATASKFIAIHEHYVLELQMSKDELSTVPWTKLYAGRELATSKTSTREMIQDWKNENEQGIKSKVKELSDGKICTHGNRQKWWHCPNCDKWERIHE